MPKYEIEKRSNFIDVRGDAVHRIVFQEFNATTTQLRILRAVKELRSENPKNSIGIVDIARKLGGEEKTVHNRTDTITRNIRELEGLNSHLAEDRMPVLDELVAEADRLELLYDVTGIGIQAKASDLSGKKIKPIF